MTMTYSEQDKAIALTTLATCRGNYSEASRLCHQQGLTASRDQIRRWSMGVSISESAAQKAQEKKRDIAEMFEEEARAALLSCAKVRDNAKYSELMTGAAIAVDKMQLLRGEATEITQQNLSEEAKALRVAELLLKAQERLTALERREVQGNGA